MHTLVGTAYIGSGMTWGIVERDWFKADEGFSIEIRLFGQRSRREAQRAAVQLLSDEGIEWLMRRGDRWAIDATNMPIPESLRSALPWLSGVFIVEAEVDAPRVDTFLGRDRVGYTTVVRFSIYRDEVILLQHERIFLSHKGCDKPLARRFSDVLVELGFSPWLDEDSCAAVFLITSTFTDEKYLRSEINYAIDQKLSKGEQFAIITLVFADADGRRNSVPDVLRPYVWKQPETEIQGLRELLRALPIQVGPPRVRDRQ